MKAEIEINCKEPGKILRSLRPDTEELNKFEIKLVADKDKLRLSVEAKDIPGILAGINSYMRLIRVAIDAMEI